MLDIFRFHYPQIAEMADQERPGIVHRLDKDTSGVLILAKSEEALERMQELFQEREMQKTYLALVKGHMRFRNGTIDLPLARSLKNRARFEVVGEDREDRREAVTDFSVIREFEKFTYVRLMPQTGRTHQLRVHLAHFGNPVLGDILYGKTRRQGLPAPGPARLSDRIRPPLHRQRHARHLAPARRPAAVHGGEFQANYRDRDA